MTKKILAIAVLAFAATTFADTAPSLIPFQGKLTNDKGVVYTEGQYSIAFCLYDQAIGGTKLWEERHERVGVINGMINVFLGSITPLASLDFSETKYLGITVDADGNPNSYDPEMVPRQMILPSFFAKNAQFLQGHDWSAILTGDSTIDMEKRYLKLAKIEDETLTSNKIKNGTILPEDFSADVINSMVPVGVIMSFAAPINKIPAGWLPCDGRIIERSKYAALFDVIGTDWNAMVKGELTENCIPLQTLRDIVEDHSIRGDEQEWGYVLKVYGSVFGAEPGQGRYIASNMQYTKYGWSANYNQGFDTSLSYSFDGYGAGTYRVLFTKMANRASTYALKLTYDGVDHSVEIPDDGTLSSNLWTQGPDIVVLKSLDKITASFSTLNAGACIPALQVIQVTPDIVHDANESEFRVPDLTNLKSAIHSSFPTADFNYIIKY